MIGAIGVGAVRNDMQDLTTTLQEPAGTKIAFGEWWGHIKPCKGLAQWKTKLTSLGAPPETIKTIGAFKDVGELIYSHLAEDGSWNAEAMQTIKITKTDTTQTTEMTNTKSFQGASAPQAHGTPPGGDLWCLMRLRP
ncbi:unnamed protein product [Prorocentrum cordatum]|uniref:Uncharacterized protein n=1 Tax=Prorocentrum cordatum TaxID=2364126 RepID=A0ABN9WEN8_9DINO|nr:unnamed protein product [Polarella glacialis]